MPATPRIDLAEVVARKNELGSFARRAGQQASIGTRHARSLSRPRPLHRPARQSTVNGETLRSDRIFINTGTRPRIPPIPGLDQVPYLTNRNIMDLDGSFPSTCGRSAATTSASSSARCSGASAAKSPSSSSTTRSSRARIRKYRRALRDALEAEGMHFRSAPRHHKIAAREVALDVTIEKKDGSRRDAARLHLLVAIGQLPNSDDLGLDKAGVETDEHGYIRHNGRLETNVPGIWVIGDVKGGPAFTHVSYDDHLVIYDNLIDGKDRSIDGRILPYALYTDPELGRVGLTETEARAAGYQAEGRQHPDGLGRARHRARRDARPHEGRHQRRQRPHPRRRHPRPRGRRAGADPDDADDGGPALDAVRRSAMFIHPTLAEGFFALMDSVKAA